MKFFHFCDMVQAQKYTRCCCYWFVCVFFFFFLFEVEPQHRV